MSAAEAFLHGNFIEQAKQTLRDLGGITHQSVSGFLMTGSSGGSLQYGIDENLLALLDGERTWRDCIAGWCW